MQKLVIQDDEGKTTVVPLIRDEITIGRKEGNTIRLTERNVSRKHARIMRTNGSVHVEDLNSYNGVRVNGSRISGRCQLSISDRVQIGDYLIELKAEGGEVGADPYGDQKTQPIERIDPMAASGAAHPSAGNGAGVPASAADMAPTTKQPMTPQVQTPPAVPAAAALADTDPAAAAAAAPAAQVQGNARLVVLSTNFAGRDFELTKPAMVIGRTEENDVVMNHRSISRHHAKIVQENGRYAIVDLQSSNGVRVNGEEYGKVELRRGDVIDLGHVRMRFVEAGEDFVFGRDAQAVDITPRGGNKTWLWAVLALLVVVGGIAIFVASSGGGGDEEPGPAEQAGVLPDDGDKTQKANDSLVKDDPVADLDDADDAGGDVEEPQNEQAKAALAEARDAVANEAWDDALAAAKRVLALEPDNEAAKKIEAQADRERQNEIKYNKFLQAVNDKKNSAVASLFEDIDHDSIYRDRARTDHDAMKKAYIEKIEAEARRLSNRSKCSDIKRLATRASKVWADAGRAATAIERRCRDDRTAKKDDKKDDKDVKKDDKKDDTKDDKKDDPSASSGKTTTELISEAQTAAKAHQFGKALRLCQDALKKSRGHQQAVMVCAIAACNLKNVSKAKKYIGQLKNAERKQMARQICLRNGVKL